MLRGGDYGATTISGMFRFGRNIGTGGTSFSFRSVLSLLNYGLKIVKQYFFKTQSRGS